MTAVALTKAELRRTRQNLARLLPPGGRPLSAAEVVEVNADIAKIDQMIVESANAVERGRLVLSWRIPRELAPTMNEFGHAKFWRKKKWKAQLDDALIKILPAFPEAPVNGSEVKRWVRATRFSTQRVDELSCDVLGLKLGIDCLVRNGVLFDDDEKHLHREPRWEKCKRGETHCLLEVFLTAHEQAPAPEPAFEKVEQLIHKPGMFTEMLKAGGVK